jgi:hypothetical protein
MPKKYSLPAFLESKVNQESYEKWLYRKAQAHLKRDRGRGNISATGESYRLAIHAAVIHSNGIDAYTGEVLDWSLISRYDNDESRTHGRAYKQQFALLPTVDHVGDGIGPADFKICSWRTNDSKSDLSLDEFLRLCKAVLVYHRFSVST